MRLSGIWSGEDGGGKPETQRVHRPKKLIQHVKEDDRDLVRWRNNSTVGTIVPPAGREVDAGNRMKDTADGVQRTQNLLTPSFWDDRFCRGTQNNVTVKPFLHSLFFSSVKWSLDRRRERAVRITGRFGTTLDGRTRRKRTHNENKNTNVNENLNPLHVKTLKHTIKRDCVTNDELLAAPPPHPKNKQTFGVVAPLTPIANLKYHDARLKVAADRFLI
jgi:hypothetical protein